MRHTRRNGLVTLMATGGALALAVGAAHADADASGVAAESPGVISGNAVQLPVDVPVNVCGNTVNVVGLLNPAAGNTCANKGAKGSKDSSHGAHKDRPGSAHGGHGGAPGTHGGGNGGGADADAAMVGSPGVITGNGVQLPFDLPVNVSGNSVSVVGLLNPAFGNHSSNNGAKPPQVVTPPKPEEPTAPPKGDKPVVPPAPEQEPEPAPAAPAPAPAPAADGPSLALTGAGDLAGLAVPAAGMLLAGALLYRRFRPTAERA
ncbi:chaplin [Streptomyces sp. DH12]|uniref:chaplin n=1 Tax=Streptomyces sp. DH12 TaxID=2857010 RepID=UPI0027D32CD8|nr:chaplin [Streptomyces sp. DH12]